ncbi:MAG: UbiA family prenyltransferase [Candidatus Omnitrophica bacterium]|nr:UbiA family prenyltransferase [Candidatus Omnitrophota bacterium]
MFLINLNGAEGSAEGTGWGSMVNKIQAFLELIKFEHSIFALPFAYLGLFVAEGGLPRLRVFLWVTVAMVAIRTVGMCLNRLADQLIDAKNPRTVGRIALFELLKRWRVWVVTFASTFLFLFSCTQLNSLCLALSPVPLVLVWIYPYLKRITWLSHLILGIILGIAPLAGWLASRPEWAWRPVVLSLAVTTWVSGFDMFYALQDIDFDRTNGLKSFPVRFGTQTTIVVVRILHLMTIASLAGFGVLLGLGFWYWLGWFLSVTLIVKEHRLVSRYGLVKINEAFFDMNAWVSVVIFAAVALDLTLRT